MGNNSPLGRFWQEFPYSDNQLAIFKYALIVLCKVLQVFFACKTWNVSVNCRVHVPHATAGIASNGLIIFKPLQSRSFLEVTT